MNRYKKLSEVVKYSSKRIISNRVSIDNFITTDNILPNKGGVVLATSLPPNGESMPSYSAKNILVGNIRPYLRKIWYADKSGGCSADVLVFEVNEGYDPKFVYYSMFRDEFFVHMMKGSKGTKMPRGDKNQILDFLIPNLELDEQQTIASVLSSLDTKIELNNRINAELEAMAKTIYDYWFVQFDFPFDFAQGKPDADGRPYKSSGGKMVWSEELKRDVPEGWGVKALREFADTASGGTPLSTKNEYYRNGSIAWINSGELNNPYIMNSKNFITKEGMDNSNAKLFEANTLLIAMYGATAGKVALLNIPACTNQAICAIIPEFKILTYYLKFAFEDLYKYLINLSSGSARDNLSQDVIRDLRFTIPSDGLLVKFNDIVSPMIKMICSNLIENQKLSHLRDWLLPMLMNGQVRVG